MTVDEAAAIQGRNRSVSLRKGITILRRLADADGVSDGLTLTALAASLQMNKATVLRLLAPLCESRLVDRDESSGRYRLGFRAAQLGSAFLDGLDIRNAAHDVLVDLSAEAGETTHLVVPELPFVVYIDKVESTQPVRMHSRVGMQHPAYSTAVGKALLAHGDDGAFDLVVANGLARRTPNTIVSVAALAAELESIRQRGYAVDNIENEVDVRCTGAAIFDSSGKACAALSISGPADRLTTRRLEECGAAVSASAARISERLGASERAIKKRH